MTDRILNSFQHIIWDWNGTLLDDVDLSVEIINSMLRERTMPEIDQATYQEIFEFPVKTYYRILGFDFSAEPFEQLAAQYIRLYASRVGHCKLHVEAMDTLASVAKQGISQSVLSSLEHSSLLKEIEQHRLGDYFESVRGLDDHYAAGKIDTGRILIGQLAAEPLQIVLIGDTAHDFEVANELGIECILVANGHYSRQRLQEVHGRVVDSLQLLN